MPWASEEGFRRVEDLNELFSAEYLLYHYLSVAYKNISKIRSSARTKQRIDKAIRTASEFFDNQFGTQAVIEDFNEARTRWQFVPILREMANLPGVPNRLKSMTKNYLNFISAFHAEPRRDFLAYFFNLYSKIPEARRYLVRYQDVFGSDRP